MLFPVILSGGSGSRLWPLSREGYPKQLLSLLSDKTLLQNTITRLNGIEDLANPIIVCNQEHRFLIAEQLSEINVQAMQIILEPVGKNTAPAVAIAALFALQIDEDAKLLILPADHLIQNIDIFHQAIITAKSLALYNNLVTFGIVPQHAETGYGYIKAAHKIINHQAFRVEQFVEKPDLDTADKYVKSKQYFWNSGMFLFKASDYILELDKYEPEILATCIKTIENTPEKRDYGFTRLDKDSFTACPSKSIDYAVMEHTKKAAMVTLDAGWNDIGVWSSLWNIDNKNENGNVCKGDIITHDVTNSYLRAEDRLLAVLGLDNIIVIETADAILVADKNKSQDVKNIVAKLKNSKRKEVILHSKVHRPWGSYETLVSEERFKVKRIIVKPKCSLSLQMHYHRSEHWVVVRGTAEVIKGNEQFNLAENESTYISLGTKHRLNNPGKITLEIIETQSGSYLGEDDIIRFDDNYGR
jgi:mannose-1-phosphate guanylyltransferase/mannose-6-phosphate isomerase